MAVMICLLRGVNVGGHNMIKMDVLRALCESLGHCDVQTYVQSGNVVFRTKERDVAKIAQKLKKRSRRSTASVPMSSFALRRKCAK